MGFMDKVKNFFYEDIDEDEEVVVKEPKVKKEKVKEQREFFKETKKENKIEEQKEVVEDNKKDDLSELELFKSERTFNFPMDLGDDIFDDDDKQEEVVSKKEERPIYSREKSRDVKSNITSSGYSGISKARLSAEVKDEGPKKFKPTPVVSPVYGILDKNYTVEDVVDKNLSKTKEFSIDKKIVDFDTVRNRAYKELDEEIEKTLSGTKDIFFNLDEESKKDEEDEKEELEESDVIITFDNGEDNTEEEKNDIALEKEETPEEDEDNEEDFDFEPDVAITPKKKVTPEKKKKEKEDLFNLIDNMYKDEEEDED